MEQKVYRSIDIGLAYQKATGKKMDPPRTETELSHEVAKFLAVFRDICKKSTKFSLTMDKRL